MKSSRGKKALLSALASAALFSALAVAAGRLDALDGARLFWLDQLFAARQRLGAAPPVPPEVLIVGVDEPTLAAARRRFGETQDRRVIRRVVAQLLVKLAQARAKVAGVDFLFTVPAGDDVDGLLAGALGGGDELGTGGIDAVLACHLTLAEQKRPIETFRQWAAEGNIILQADSDGRFRRASPGLVVNGEIPLFSFQLCRLFVGLPDEAGSALGTAWRWNDHADGSLEVPGRLHVAPETLIDFAGPAQFFEMNGRQFSALDVLDGRVPPDTFTGKMVLVGPSFRNQDRFAVSVSPSAADPEYRRFFERKYGLDLSELEGAERTVGLMHSGAMSGVEILANLAGQMLQGRYLRETAREAPWLSPALTAGLLFGLGWVFWQAPARGRRRVVRGIAGGGVLFLAVLAGAAAASLWLFVRFRWVWVPLELMGAWSAQALCGITFTGVQLRRQNRRIEEMFGSAVGEQLLDYIHAHPDILTTSRRRTATVLFCDIRGFTPLTARLGSDEVVDLLRGHFEALWKALADEGAWVDKYVGDLVMAAWNVLEPAEDHTLRAVRAAVAMQAARARLNADRAARGEGPVAVGIGVHTGELVCGNIGSVKRSNYTLIGETVNLASRIEHEAAGGQVLISEDTYRLVAARVAARPLPPRAIRGLEGEYTLYEVTGLDDGV